MPRLTCADPFPAHQHHRPGRSDPLRIAVIGGGPAGSLFALYALRYARSANRELSLSIYEGRDFRNFGPRGCNMCAGMIPVSQLGQFEELGINLPPELILSRISTYSLHTSVGTLNALRPAACAEIVSVYRGAGPRPDHPPGLLSFDQLLLEHAVSMGAALRPSFVESIRRGNRVEIISSFGTETYDLAVLATGVNGRALSLQGFQYKPPPTGPMCQAEVYLGTEEVQHRLGSSVHIFLPPSDVAAYGILIPKGPYVAVSLLGPRHQMRSLRSFLDLDQVSTLLGAHPRLACGCPPRISVGPAMNVVEDGFVAIGDASSTRLYKNGIGSALSTAERAAWTAIYSGCSKIDLAASYLPLCRTIDEDNRIGRLLFLQVLLLKRFRALQRAHYRLAAAHQTRVVTNELHTRILWGMFTGAFSYRDLLRMALSPALLFPLAVATGRSLLGGPFPEKTPPPQIEAVVENSTTPSGH